MSISVQAMDIVEMDDMYARRQTREQMKSIISAQANVKFLECMKEKGDILVKVIQEDQYVLAQNLIPISDDISIEAAYMEISGAWKEIKSLAKGIIDRKYRTSYNTTVDMIERRLRGPRWRCRTGELYKCCGCSTCLLRHGIKPH